MIFMENMDEWTGIVDQCVATIGSITSEDDKEKGIIEEM